MHISIYSRTEEASQDMSEVFAVISSILFSMSLFTHY